MVLASGIERGSPNVKNVKLCDTWSRSGFLGLYGVIVRMRELRVILRAVGGYGRSGGEFAFRAAPTPHQRYVVRPPLRGGHQENDHLFSNKPDAPPCP